MYEVNLDNIYSSLEEIKPTTTYEDRTKAYTQLTGKFQTAKELSRACGFNTRGSCVHARKVITELIECEMRPIIATSRGFKIAVTIDELKEYRESLKKRNKGLLRRIRAVEVIIDSLEPLDVQQKIIEAAR